MLARRGKGDLTKMDELLREDSRDTAEKGRGAARSVPASTGPSAPTTLFIAELPQEPRLEQPELEAIFAQRSGFASCRLRTDRSNKMVAFVEFRSEGAAQSALEELQGHKIRESDASGIKIALSRNPSNSRSGAPPGVGGRGPPGVGAGPGGFQMNPMPMPSPAQGSIVGGGGAWGGGGGFVHPFLAAPVQPKLPATLYVEGISMDATEREVAHLFRPFPAFKALRLRESGQRRLCFVEFTDIKCAHQALAILNDYIFDTTDSGTTTLRISFAKSSSSDRSGSRRDRSPARAHRAAAGGARSRSRSRSPRRPR